MKLGWALKSFALVLLSTIIPHLGMAQNTTPDCSHYEDPTIHIDAQFGEPQYDYTKNIPAILNLESDHNHSLREGIPLGVTDYEKILSTNTRTRVIQRSNGLSCIKIDHIDIIIGYKNVVVYIADEIPPDSCGFHEVMAHEQKHLNVNQHLLQEAIPKIEQQFLEHIRQRGVYHSIDPMLPRNDMQEFLASVMNSFDTENVQRQQRVDSPEEYHRVSVSCNGQLAIISQHYRLTGQ